MAKVYEFLSTHHNRLILLRGMLIVVGIGFVIELAQDKVRHEPLTPAMIYILLVATLGSAVEVGLTYKKVSAVLGTFLVAATVIPLVAVHGAKKEDYMVGMVESLMLALNQIIYLVAPTLISSWEKRKPLAELTRPAPPSTTSQPPSGKTRKEVLSEIFFALTLFGILSTLTKRTWVMPIIFLASVILLQAAEILMSIHIACCSKKANLNQQLTHGGCILVGQFIANAFGSMFGWMMIAAVAHRSKVEDTFYVSLSMLCLCVLASGLVRVCMENRATDHNEEEATLASGATAGDDGIAPPGYPMPYGYGSTGF